MTDAVCFRSGQNPRITSDGSGNAFGVHLKDPASLYTVYILKCRGGSLYTGITTDIERRLKEHASGKASKYTRSKLPVRLVYSEKQPDESSAKKREYAIKQMDRKTKTALIRKR